MLLKCLIGIPNFILGFKKKKKNPKKNLKDDWNLLSLEERRNVLGKTACNRGSVRGKYGKFEELKRRLLC